MLIGNCKNEVYLITTVKIPLFVSISNILAKKEEVTAQSDWWAKCKLC